MNEGCSTRSRMGLCSASCFVRWARALSAQLSTTAFQKEQTVKMVVALSVTTVAQRNDVAPTVVAARPVTVGAMAQP